MKHKTPIIISALVLTLCASSGLAQTPKTKLRQKAAPAPQKTLLAPVKVGDKWGYKDKTGTIVIQPQFPHLAYFERFSEGLADGKIGDKYGYIDKTAKIIIPAQFTFAG